jgi:hypothetical protein
MMQDIAPQRRHCSSTGFDLCSVCASMGTSITAFNAEDAEELRRYRRHHLLLSTLPPNIKEAGGGTRRPDRHRPLLPLGGDPGS